MTQEHPNETQDQPAQAPAIEQAPLPPANEPARRRSPARAARPIGTGVMASRTAADEPAAPREVIDQAANTARTTGHRFDLMRYLRLRRRDRT